MNRESFKIESKIIASDTKELYDLAISKGIQMPHPSLSIFKSVLAEISKPNANGIRLGEKATEAAVSTLIGCQINKNHLRTGFVMGHIIDAQINNDKDIEISCIFFKDLYEDEWVEAQELFAKGKLTMSFELSADVESQTKCSDGTKILNDYYFTGSGLLFGISPACKRAKVFEMATKKLQEKLSVERQSLIFANNQNSQKSILEVLNLMADEVKKIEEVKVEDVVVETPVVAAEPIVEPVAEVVVAQPVVEEAPKDVVVVTETTQKVTDTLSQDSETIKVETTEVRTIDDQEKVRTVVVQETTYTYAQVEEIKAGYEKQVAELKEQLVAKEAELLLATKKEEIVVAEEKPVLATGHKKVIASEDGRSPLATVMQIKKANRK